MEERPEKAIKSEEKTEKVLTPVVEKPAVRKQKSLGEKFKNTFLGAELKTAALYVANDVLIPAIRNLIVDTTTKGIERIIYGDETPRRRHSYGGGVSRYSYNSPVNRRPNLPDQPRRSYSGRVRQEYELDDVIFNSRAEADLVLERLTDVVDQYEATSVADLFELSGLPSTHTDQNWGWTDLVGADVRQTRNGYILVLPPTVLLK